MAPTITCRWHPIFDIITHNEIPLTEEIINLFNFIREQARPRIDKKLPVSHMLLNQQLKGLDSFIAQGYENMLTKATLATAWAAQLRVSEYSSKLVADVRSGDDHNLKQNSVLVQNNGLTVIFSSDKTSSQCKEHFISWDNVPIEGFQKLMEKYNRIKSKVVTCIFLS